MSLDQDAVSLSRHPLFALLEPEALRLLAFSAEPVRLALGETLFEQGQAADCAFLLLAGRIAFAADDGSKPPLYIAEPGSLIGETTLVTATERQARAQALEPASLLRIARPQFHRVLREFPDAAARVHGRLAAQLAEFAAALAPVRQKMLG